MGKGYFAEKTRIVNSVSKSVEGCGTSHGYSLWSDSCNDGCSSNYCNNHDTATSYGTSICYSESTTVSETTGSSSIQYVDSDKPQFSGRKTIIKFENEGHSFVYALLKPDALYVAVDSFAVQKDSSTNEKYAVETIIQNYKKLAIIQKEEKPTIVISSEKNGSKTLTELASGTTEDFFNSRNLNKEDYLMFRFEDKDCKFRKPIYGYWADFKRSMYIGEPIFVKLADNFVEPNSTDEKEVVAYINKLYKALVAVSELTTNSVGGSIHIGKLTPDGFTWLQNGYEL